MNDEKWFSIFDELPPKTTNVILYDAFCEVVVIGWFDGKNFIIDQSYDNTETFDATHWTFIPELTNLNYDSKRNY